MRAFCRSCDRLENPIWRPSIALVRHATSCLCRGCVNANGDSDSNVRVSSPSVPMQFQKWSLRLKVLIIQSLCLQRHMNVLYSYLFNQVYDVISRYSEHTYVRACANDKCYLRDYTEM
jgi:hypothetical protein